MADKIAPAAFGEAIVELAEQYPELVVLDADLSGRHHDQEFFQAYPGAFSTWASPRATWSAWPPALPPAAKALCRHLHHVAAGRALSRCATPWPTPT